MKCGPRTSAWTAGRRPRKGAWIEICPRLPDLSRILVAPARGRGLKFTIMASLLKPFSRPRKGAWIEILDDEESNRIFLSPPQGGVD